jgi:D-beta-D-heptose 7-phosphate kinase/D-beta-D-heptose 1-phosphate adenosyltransferase
MQHLIPDFDKARILVAGDLMLDRYWSGPASRVSPEAPVPVVHVQDTSDRPGGAGNVALNVAALGARCSLLAVVGHDDAARITREQLTAANIQCDLIDHPDFKTITKLRILSQHQQLIRLDFEGQDTNLCDGLLPTQFGSLLKTNDLVVLSDYGKGTLNDVQKLIAMSQDASRPVVVDPKGRDFSKYAGATVITPNFNEFQAIVGECPDENTLQERAGNLIAELKLQALLITRGEQGMSLVNANGDAVHIPTEAREVFDVTGAGDTVIATLAVSMASGAKLEDAVRLANAAAGVTVGKLGSATVSVSELKRAWHAQRGGHGALTEQELLDAVADARSNGETVVMTNGCFDILHAGHVHYLNQAASLGDRLIVAVNVDETVRQLKGEDRPVNNLESRMTVLAALAAVDWVIPFSEATPERLICAIKPDFLVKGGDNDPDKVPGASCVRDSGGQVLALDYIEGTSTTHIIGRIRDDR